MLQSFWKINIQNNQLWTITALPFDTCTSVFQRLIFLLPFLLIFYLTLLTSVFLAGKTARSFDCYIHAEGLWKKMITDSTTLSLILPSQELDTEKNDHQFFSPWKKLITIFFLHDQLLVSLSPNLCQKNQFQAPIPENNSLPCLFPKTEIVCLPAFHTYNAHLQILTSWRLPENYCSVLTEKQCCSSGAVIHAQIL